MFKCIGEEMNYIIGSGWWCDESDTNRYRIGSDKIRSEEFHHLWYQAVNTFTKPEKIFIVDSASPVPIPYNTKDSRFEVVKLTQNPGHPTKHTGKYSGWTISAMLGMEYALYCGVDYFVYIEQDALVYGEGIIEKCISAMTKPIMFGAGGKSIHPLQQSFFIIHKSEIEKFICNINKINLPDCIIPPEKKFCIASSRFLQLMPIGVFKETKHHTERNWLDRQKVRMHRRLLRRFGKFDILPIGPGGYKEREPVDFSNDYFYFQHGADDEIAEFKQKLEKEYGKSGRD